MKQILHRTFGLAFLLVLAYSAAAQGRAMEVVFTREMDKAALEKIQNDAKANGLGLEYTHMDFKDGHLVSIAFTLKTKAGTGSAETAALSADKPFGFSYDPNAGAGEAVFAVGGLK
jgi:hypothetical protein